MEENKKKIIKSAKALSIFAMILYRFLIVISIIMFGLMIFTVINKDKITEIINNPNIYITGNADKVLNCSNFIIISFFLITIINILFTALVVYVANTVFNNIKNDGVPFKLEYVHKLRFIGIALIVYCFIPTFEFNSGSLWNLNFSINFTRLIVAGVFFFLAKIFEYGCLLQKESDETL